MSTQNTVGYNDFPIPIGTVFPYAGSIIPSGYLKCNGAAYNISQYPKLYSVIGNTYLTVVSPGQFQVPQLESLYVKSVSVASGTNIPAAGTVSPFTIATANLPTIDNITVSGTLSGTINPIGVSDSVTTPYASNTAPTPGYIGATSGKTNAVVITVTNPTTEPKLTYTPPGAVAPVTFSSSVPTSTPANIEMVYIIRALDSFI
jgi:microcystin-dependent protein